MYLKKKKKEGNISNTLYEPGTVLDVLKFFKLLPSATGQRNRPQSKPYHPSPNLQSSLSNFGCPMVASTILNTLSKANVFPNLGFLICKMWIKYLPPAPGLKWVPSKS